MHRPRFSLSLSLLTLLLVLPSAQAAEGPFVGLGVGASEPTNGVYRGHVQTGISGQPFGGYMFNDYLGMQAELHIIGQQPDNDHLRARFGVTNLDHENAWTTMVGATMGPRLDVPLGEMVDLYITGQGGGFKGLSGRLNQLAPGFSVGGGIDFNVTPNVAVGFFGRWNRAYMSAHPYFLPGQVADEQGKADIRWAVGGMEVKFTFAQAAEVVVPPPPPPVPAAAPPPPPPARQKIVLRSVHFDFNKANIRPDATPVLDEAARELKDQGSITIVVEGHTDSVGTESYNLKLSRRRADAVRKYLVAHGISDSRIRTEGFGKSRPVASNDTADGRAQNRRVELHIQ